MKVQISLKAARVNANLSQDDVAEKIRKSKQTIVNWENGKTKIDAASFSTLCELYKVPPDFIFLPL